jgi:hypothetical protein
MEMHIDGAAQQVIRFTHFPCSFMPIIDWDRNFLFSTLGILGSLLDNPCIGHLGRG